MELVKVKPAAQPVLDEVGYSWDKSYTEIVAMSENDIESVYQTTNDLYALYCEAAEHAITHYKFSAFGIHNPKMIEVIKKEWEDPKFRHIWGRFDLAGGTSGKPLKLIEFNADTATALVETSVLQYAVGLTNGQKYSEQFNEVYESLQLSFSKLVNDWDKPEPISMVAFSLDTEEDNRTIAFLAECAAMVGIDVDIMPMSSLYFDRTQGVFVSDNGLHISKSYNVILKLVPWEMMLMQEPDYTDVIMDLILADELVVINPAYTLLFQSKYMLKYLYELFPNHPCLLKCSDNPLNSKHVVKPIFGREGCNVKIVEGSTIVSEEDGDYSTQPVIYQEYVELDKDYQGRVYQLGSFMCDDSCGIAFRRSESPIIVNTSEFVGHYVI